MSKAGHWAESIKQASERRSRRRTGRMMRRFPRWRNRRHRRPLVVVMGLGFVATLLTVVVDVPGGQTWLLVCLLGVMPSWLLLRILTAGVAERIAFGLDERERSLRGRYAYVGWTVAQIVMMGMFVYWNFAVEADAAGLQARGPGLLFTLAVTAMALPTALLAWNLPDDDPEDLTEPDDALQDSATTNREDGHLG